MRKTNFLSLLVLAGSMLLFTSCLDLNVENPNAPDAVRALGSPDDVEAFAGSQYQQWWNGTQKNYPGMTLAVMSGHSTSSWGNFGMFDLGAVPRQAFINSPSYADIGMSSVPWSNMYTAISSVNDVLIALDSGISFPGDTQNRAQRMEAFSRFIQGISYGVLANHFDRAFLVDETTDLEAVALGQVDLPLSDYQEVLAFALAKLDQAIAIAESSTFTLPEGWVRGNALTSAQLANLARAYKARYIVSNARTPAERDAINWAEVASLTQQVLNGPALFNNDESAFIVQADGDFWWSRPHSLMQDATWHRAFYPLIGLYDTSGQFETWVGQPLNGLDSPRREFILASADARVNGLNEDGAFDGTVAGTDFRLGSANNFPEARGLWRRSRHHHFRNREMYDNGFVGPMQHMRRAEIAMYHAEAQLRLNPGTVLQVVIDLVNETRVGRGNLPALTAADGWDYAFNAMRYEWGIETYATHAGLEYYNVRSWGNYKGKNFGAIVSGTPTMFPIPASELEILQMEVYTFGGGGAGSAARGVVDENGRRVMSAAVQRSNERANQLHVTKQ